MKVVVTGATGLIGRPLVARLVARGDTVIALVRNPDTRLEEHRAARRSSSSHTELAASRTRRLEGATLVTADLETRGAWCDALDGADAIVHLAGEPIAGKRWTAQHKQRLYDSRVETARTIVEALARTAHRPRVIVGASGVDYYPPAVGLDEFDADPVTEADPAGEGFLSRLCAHWEAEIAAASALGIRTVSMRTGLVLAPIARSKAAPDGSIASAGGAGGGALARMAAPFRFFVGGRLGSGRQLVSWIHLDDVVAAYTAALDDARFTGPVNLVAGSVLASEFARALGHALHRPSVMRVPAFALRLAVGELAESLLTGRNVVPQKLRELGFTFTYTDLAAALAACVTRHDAR